MKIKKRIKLIILLTGMFLPLVCLGQDIGPTPFEESKLPSTQTLESVQQATFDNSPLRGPGGGGPGGSEGGNSGGGVVFGPVSDGLWALCLLAIVYGFFKRKTHRNSQSHTSKSFKGQDC